MILAAKLIDIQTREVMLNIEDARTVGVLAGDRVQIINNVNGLSVAAFVDTTTTIIPRGTIGIYSRTNERLSVEDGMEVEVRVAERPASLTHIKKKMDGERLSKEETYAVIEAIVAEDLSPAEITAYITACYINEMDMDEVEHLTRAMVDTGEKIDFHAHPIVDKHSSGGVPGNKISLLVVPIIAASGLKIPKTSSRAITGAGGTADLMEVLAPVEFSATEVQQMTIDRKSVV